MKDGLKSLVLPAILGTQCQSSIIADDASTALYPLQAPRSISRRIRTRFLMNYHPLKPCAVIRAIHQSKNIKYRFWETRICCIYNQPKLEQSYWYTCHCMAG